MPQENKTTHKQYTTRRKPRNKEEIQPNANAPPGINTENIQGGKEPKSKKQECKTTKRKTHAVKPRGKHY